MKECQDEIPEFLRIFFLWKITVSSPSLLKENIHAFHREIQTSSQFCVDALLDPPHWAPNWIVGKAEPPSRDYRALECRINNSHN